MRASSPALLLVAALSATNVWSEESPNALTLEILMDHMARTAGVKARFEERKEISLLANPLHSEGSIFFIPPDRFARHTSKPGRTLLVIDGEALRYVDEFGGEDIDLSSEPIARQFVENLTGLFNGDLEALRGRYELTFESQDEVWQLTLVPRSSNIRRFVSEISLRGDGPALREMQMVEQDGDRTTTRFVEIQTDYRFSDAELADAFPSRSAGSTAESPGP